MTDSRQQDSPLPAITFWLFIFLFAYSAPSKMIFYFAGYEDANNITILTLTRDVFLSTIFWFVIYRPIWKRSKLLGILFGIILATLTGYMFFHPSPLADKYLQEKEDRENPPQYEQADGSLGPKPDPNFHWDQTTRNQSK